MFQANPEEGELEYCLVVSDKKSGTSSVVGTPDIAPSRRSKSYIVWLSIQEMFV